LWAGRLAPNHSQCFPAFFGPSGLKVVQWNGRGICLSDPAARDRSGKFVRTLSTQAHILCFEEVHGHRKEVLFQFRQWLPDWKFWASTVQRNDGSSNFGAGGVLIAVGPGIARQAIAYSPQYLVQGRCLALAIKFPHSLSLNVVALHNFDLTLPQVNAVGRFLERASAEDLVDPLSRMSILVGDFNFLAEGEQRFRIGRPAPALSLARPMPVGTQQRRWMQVLSSWTELAQPLPTHYSASSQSASRIDRGWISCPSNQIVNMDISSSTVGAPEDYEAAGLSDHAPVVFIVTSRCFSPPRPRPLAKFICRDPKFAEMVDIISRSIRLLEQPVANQLFLLNKIILEAARHVRNYSLYHRPDGSDNVRLVIDSISRAIWKQDVRLAKKLLDNSALARNYLCLSGARVSVVDPICFEQYFLEIRASQQQAAVLRLQRQIGFTQSKNKKAQLKGRLQAARRMQGVFWPTSRTLRLAGVTVSGADGIEARVADNDGIQKALREYWGPVYEHRDMDVDAANKLLRIFQSRNQNLFQFSSLALPDVDFFEEYLNKTKDSATGRNGIP